MARPEPRQDLGRVGLASQAREDTSYRRPSTTGDVVLEIIVCLNVDNLANHFGTRHRDRSMDTLFLR